MIPWFASLAMAQSETELLADCNLRPIAGLVSYETAAQAAETNAQAFGAAAFAERTLLRGSMWGFEMHTVAGAVRIPTIAECPDGTSYHGSGALDLFSSASGLMVPLPVGEGELKLFYAGSVTGSKVQYPGSNRVFDAYGYAASGIAWTYAAPLATLVQEDNALKTRAGDFIVGAALDVPSAPEVGTLTLGYVYSSGLYSNLSSQKLRLFATALLTQQFTMLALVKGGLDRVPLPGGSEATLFGRRQAILPPPTVETAPDASRVDLTSVHYQHDALADVLGFRVAFAVLPRPMLHEVAGTVVVPNDDGSGDPALESGAVAINRLFALELGRTQMPALPWYGVDGGGAFFAELAILDMLYVRRNAPDTLLLFPYAQGATEVLVRIHMAPGSVN